jgi:hypothetical protein
MSRRKGNKYPSPEVYDHVRFKRNKKKEILKGRSVWYLAIALVVLTAVLIAIITQ